MKISNLTKGILGAALFSLSSCLWAAGNSATLEDGYQVAAGPGHGHAGPGLRKGNVKSRTFDRKTDRKGSRDVKKRRKAVSNRQGGDSAE